MYIELIKFGAIRITLMYYNYLIFFMKIQAAQMSLNYNMIFHHTGCLTLNIEKSLQIYQQMGCNTFSEIYSIPDQKVKVCFVQLSEGTFLELVEPFEDNRSLNKLLKKNASFYHLGFMTDDFENTIKQLESNSFYLINTFHSAAFSNKLCAFLFTPEMHLIEIIQK